MVSDKIGDILYVIITIIIEGRINMTKKKKSLLIVLSVIIVICAALCAAFIPKVCHNHGNNVNTSNSETVTVPEKYNEYYERNHDFVGWIRIDGTKIDYPVVRGSDNSFYLSHNFDKEPEARGTIYMAYDCDPELKSKNTVIHGHNWLDDTVFSELAQYSDFDYYKKHPVIEFNTRTQMHKWKIVAVFITSADPAEDNDYVFNYVYPNMGGENFSKYSNELKKRTLFNTGVDYYMNDSFITLSTCTRDVDKDGKRADCRIAVVARMVRDNESEKVDISQAEINNNPKYPQIWYTNHNKDNPYIHDEQWYPYELED